jgi:hypothetical protein
MKWECDRHAGVELVGRPRKEYQCRRCLRMVRLCEKCAKTSVTVDQHRRCSGSWK